MTYQEKTWEDELLDLINETEHEKEKAIQRLESAKKAISSIEYKIEAMRITLDAYRKKYGVSQLTEHSPTLAIVYQSMNPEEMLNYEADTHNEVVVMNRLVHDVVSAGVYPNVEYARSTLYRTIARLPEFWKMTPGEYRRMKSTKISSDDNVENQDALSEFTDNDLIAIDSA